MPANEEWDTPLVDLYPKGRIRMAMQDFDCDAKFRRICQGKIRFGEPYFDTANPKTSRAGDGTLRFCQRCAKIQKKADSEEPASRKTANKRPTINLSRT